MNNDCLFPTIVIDIDSPQGNAYCIMGIVANALKECAFTKEQINSILDDMKSSDYDHLVSVAKRYVTIVGT